jgi:hypothetical protein
LNVAYLYPLFLKILILIVFKNEVCNPYLLIENTALPASYKYIALAVVSSGQVFISSSSWLILPKTNEGILAFLSESVGAMAFAARQLLNNKRIETENFMKTICGLSK